MRRLLPIGLTVVVADQASKWWISGVIPQGQTRVVLPALLHFTHVYNPGAAFGLFPSQQWLFVSAAVAVLLYAWFQREQICKQPLLMQAGIVLGLAGAVGNTIDRLWRGAVLDFIDIIILPVFNVADIAITSGVALVIWTVLVGRHEEGDAAWKD